MSANGNHHIDRCLRALAGRRAGGTCSDDVSAIALPHMRASRAYSVHYKRQFVWVHHTEDSFCVRAATTFAPLISWRTIAPSRHDKAARLDDTLLKTERSKC